MNCTLFLDQSLNIELISLSCKQMPLCSFLHVYVHPCSLKCWPMNYLNWHKNGHPEDFRINYKGFNYCYCYLSPTGIDHVYNLLSRPMEPPSKKEVVPVMRRPDEWKDPWRRSKSPRRRPGLGSPPRGRRRHRPSGSSVSLSNSSRYEVFL